MCQLKRKPIIFFLINSNRCVLSSVIVRLSPPINTVCHRSLLLHRLSAGSRRTYRSKISLAGPIFRASRCSLFSIRAAKLSLPGARAGLLLCAKCVFVQPFSVSPSFRAGSSLCSRRAPCTSSVSRAT